MRNNQTKKKLKKIFKTVFLWFCNGLEAYCKRGLVIRD